MVKDLEKIGYSLDDFRLRICVLQEFLDTPERIFGPTFGISEAGIGLYLNFVPTTTANPTNPSTPWKPKKAQQPQHQIQKYKKIQKNTKDTIKKDPISKAERESGA